MASRTLTPSPLAPSSSEDDDLPIPDSDTETEAITDAETELMTDTDDTEEAAVFNVVTVLCEGYSRWSDTHISSMYSNCTTTLIRSKSGKYTLVDTQTPWHRDQLLAALERHGICASDINHLICTHGHSDHVGNNNLFTSAQLHIVGHDVSCRDLYTLHDFSDEDPQPYPLGDGIRVIATPGHTPTCVSVVVPDCGKDGKDTVVVVGDLFECVDDIQKEYLWTGAGSHNDVQQRVQRLRIAEMATHIVPGHGPMFRVTEQMLIKLRLSIRS